MASQYRVYARTWLCLWLGACGAENSDPGSDSSTHFFDSCGADSDCDGEYSCQCNRCTLPCTSDDQCGAAEAMCLPATSIASCELVGNVCAPFVAVVLESPSESRDAGGPAPEDVDPPLSDGSDVDSGALESPIAPEPTTDVPLPVIVDAGAVEPAPSVTSTTGPGPNPPVPVPTMEADAGLPPVIPEPEPTEAIPTEPECPGAPECSWEELPSLPSATRGHGVVEIDGTVWVFGGENPQDRVMSLALDASEWESHEPMPTGAYSLGAQRVGERVLVQTGFGGPGFVSVLQAYSPAEDTWVELAPMPSYRYLFATGVVDDRFYVIGGQGPANGTTVDQVWDYKGLVQVYDVATDTWSDATPELEPTASAASCTLGSRIFLFGGEASNRTTIYDAALDSWSEGTPPPLERNGHSCVVVGNLFYLLGGRSTAGGGLAQVETYDPETDTWEALPDMPEARYWFGAAAANDIIYVVGGVDTITLLDTVWEYTVE